jgi:hypothetical protein
MFIDGNVLGGQEVERAMGVEPTREALPGLENKRFAAIARSSSQK